MAFMCYEFVGFDISPSFEPIASNLVMFVGFRIMNDGMNTNRLAILSMSTSLISIALS
jgi:hypothetical protein